MEPTVTEILKLEKKEMPIHSLHLNNSTLYLVDEESVSKYELES